MHELYRLLTATARLRGGGWGEMHPLHPRPSFQVKAYAYNIGESIGFQSDFDEAQLTNLKYGMKKSTFNKRGAKMEKKFSLSRKLR